jgi:probable phosphoglycerate mutase
MTTFLLLRHAHSTANDAGILAGRLDGVDLSIIGKTQARVLGNAFKDVKIDRIISSPLDRCVQTIAGAARGRRKRIYIDERFIEMDYGLWNGRKLKELAKEKSWKEIQSKPSTFTFPQGESFSDAALRIEKGLQSLMRRHPQETILIVTHGDIIKMALQLSHGGSLDNFQHFLVDTCSLSEIHWTPQSKTIVRSNSRLVKVKSLRAAKKRMKQRRVLGGGAGV